MEVRYYICKHCGNIVEKVKDKGVPVICCGEPMQELKAGVTDAAVEKHVPVYTIEGSHVHVVVGETKHPMLEEHFIEWITLNTNQGIYRKQLNPGQEPVADFCLAVKTVSRQLIRLIQHICQSFPLSTVCIV